MSTESSPLAGPSMLAVLRGAVDAIRRSPAIVGLFLASGLLGIVLPAFIGTAARLLVILVGVVVAYRALGGRTRTDSPFLLRLFMAFLATVASYLSVLVGGMALAVPGTIGWVGFFVFALPGLYLYFRLFLSTPAVMIDGYGPAEALTVSWRLMNGSVLATTFSVALVFVCGLVVLVPLLVVTQSSFIADIGGVLVMDPTFDTPYRIDKMFLS
jgi:hypothetical protein